MGSIGMNVLTYGMQSFGIDSSIQTIITGIVIVVIMAYTANKGLFGEFINKVKSRRKEKNVDGCTGV